MKRVLFRAEMASKMLDGGEEDDLDLERLADKLIATLRSIMRQILIDVYKGVRKSRRI